MPEVGDPTVRREPPKAGLVTGVKSEQGSRIGRCGWITSFLREEVRACIAVELSGEYAVHTNESNAEDSGGDALRGHTRTHPEHDG